jgi:hypothetical protein
MAAKRGGKASGFGQSMAGLAGSLRGMAAAIAVGSAVRATPALTALLRKNHGVSRNVYGDLYPASKLDGHQLDLKASGATEAGLNFQRIGSIVRCALPTPYAKYLVGKYKILPNGGIPVEFKRIIDSIVPEVERENSPAWLRKHLGDQLNFKG